MVEYENLKTEFDNSEDKKSMKNILRKIFSFERIAYMSNQIDAYKDIIENMTEKIDII